jgi:hypothetical protein
MIRLGVISDTHLASPNPDLDRIVREHFGSVDVLIHLGDFVDYSVASFLMRHHEFVGVAGNMDPPDIRNAFPRKHILELESLRIGVIHGWGAPVYLEDRIFREFHEVHAILYGHTHKAVCHQRKGVLFFNPGSPTRSFFAKPTVGVVSIGDTITGEILRVDR